MDINFSGKRALVTGAGKGSVFHLRKVLSEKNNWNSVRGACCHLDWLSQSRHEVRHVW